jgi:dienelactone hydrolase
VIVTAPCAISAILIAAATLAAQVQPPKPVPSKPAAAKPQAAPFIPTEQQTRALADKVAALNTRINHLRPLTGANLLADIEITNKAAIWALRFPEEFYTRAYYDNALRAADLGMKRAGEIEAAGKSAQPSWTRRAGSAVLGYRSRVDDSVQPYAIKLPASYDGTTPHRLDLVLHGRGATLTEVSFLAQHEDGLDPARKPGDKPRDGIIELHVFGRTNNAYRWAGETDVFEALDDAKARYNIDPTRIVLRGFSMGGAGAWHIGLHYAGLWAAIEAGAGFNETLRYARLERILEHQVPLLNIYDAYRYALNTFNVPTVGYGGELDPQLQASKNIQEQLALEKQDGIRALFLVGPQTEHRWHPDSKEQSDAFIDAQIAKPRPSDIHFVTYTAKYNRIAGYEIVQLARHYERTELHVEKGGIRTKNIARLRFDSPRAVTIDGTRFSKPVQEIEKRGSRWREAKRRSGLRKVRGLQGPIDDAFMESFLVVRPTRDPVNSFVHDILKKDIETFQREWAKWMRGDIRIKNDTGVTDADIRGHHLILFGEPASNALLDRIAKQLPFDWERKWIKLRNTSYSASKHILKMIYPNPLNPERYAVINSGHTFGEKEFRGTNAMLFPRLGDFAVIDGDTGQPVVAGQFDELWRLP